MPSPRAPKTEIDGLLLCLACGHRRVWHRTKRKAKGKSCCTGPGCYCVGFLKPTLGSGLYGKPIPIQEFTAARPQPDQKDREELLAGQKK